METALISGDHGATPSPDDWLSRLSQDRPTYNCPTCLQEAMQFHHHLDSQPGREDFYYCCACGLFWEL